ncbi:MAG TPA: glycosyltransferase family 4 protein [Longimicrobium sp.]|jgi:glycosyltransferase involved in cell wall biosynthesis|uniref:glycosyltransferase family 4 protein n=1 Tax=Longimicrobium sp. TaxID=2029185 RepID=UPI002EDB76BC
MPSLLWVNHFAVSPEQGGGTRHFELGRELVRRGWDVTIAASDLNLHTRTYSRRAGPGDAAARDESIDGVRFRWLWAAPYLRNDWRRARNWLSFSQRVWRWTGPRPDVVIGSSPHLFAALAAERLARRWRVPFVFEVRDLWPESLLAGGDRAGTAYRVLGRVADYLYRRADRIVVLAGGSGAYLRERGIPAERLVHVPNGVDVSAFAAVQRPAREGLTLVYTGAHGPMNGLETVLDAAQLLADRPDIRFLLVGDGPVKPALRADAERRGLRNVEFRDSIPKTAMPALLAEADAGLMVLREAPLFAFGVSPNKLFDYFGAALPVVCNVPGEVAEMVRAAGAGEQAADASAAALAGAAVRMLARTADERRRMGVAGRAWVSREHDRPVLADRMDAMLRGLLPAHASR